jgi:hypothetical protein
MKQPYRIDAFDILQLRLDLVIFRLNNLMFDLDDALSGWQ